MNAHGSRYYMFLAVAAIFVIWLTAWDVILHAAGLQTGSPLSGHAVGMHSGLVGGAIAFWGMVQFSKWNLRFLWRFDTYVGYIVLLLGSVPIRLFLPSREAALPAPLWVLVGAVVIGKLAVWVSWYRLFLLRGIISMRDQIGGPKHDSQTSA